MDTLEKIEYTIYKIRHKNPFILNLYVGSTMNFNNRKCVHKLRVENVATYTNQLYMYIRALGGWDQFIMEPVESILCTCRAEAEEREAYWIAKLNANMNSYRKTNMSKEQRLYNRLYYLKNQEKILTRTRKNYKYVKIERPEGAHC
jgi:hypothetical protein